MGFTRVGDVDNLAPPKRKAAAGKDKKKPARKKAPARGAAKKAGTRKPAAKRKTTRAKRG